MLNNICQFLLPQEKNSEGAEIEDPAFGRQRLVRLQCGGLEERFYDPTSRLRFEDKEIEGERDIK
jgi:hypothetical protein